MMIKKLKKDKAKETIASMDKWIAEIKKAGVDVVEEESNMKISIPIGTRGKATEFRDSYTRDFLSNYNFIVINFVNNGNYFRALVKTKYGYIAVCGDEQVTYVGDGIWSVSHD